MIDRFIISRTQSANFRSMSAPFLEIISGKDCTIDDKLEEDPNFKLRLNPPYYF